MICGFVLGFVIYGPFDDTAELIFDKWRAIRWCFFTLLIPYCCLLLSSVSIYLSIFIPAAFVFLGIRLGLAAEFLTVVAGVKGFCNFLFIYLPVCFAAYLLMTLALSCNLPYLSGAPSCGRYPNCNFTRRTILLRFLIIFLINLLFYIIYMLIFGSFINIIIIVV